MDVRLLAILLVIVGMFFGLLPFFWLSALTAGTVLGATLFLRDANKKHVPGTSGTMGLFAFVIGATILTFIPAWVVYVIRLIV